MMSVVTMMRLCFLMVSPLPFLLVEIIAYLHLKRHLRYKKSFIDERKKANHSPLSFFNIMNIDFSWCCASEEI